METFVFSNKMSLHRIFLLCEWSSNFKASFSVFLPFIFLLVAHHSFWLCNIKRIVCPFNMMFHFSSCDVCTLHTHPLYRSHCPCFTIFRIFLPFMIRIDCNVQCSISISIDAIYVSIRLSTILVSLVCLISSKTYTEGSQAEGFEHEEISNIKTSHKKITIKNEIVPIRLCQWMIADAWRSTFDGFSVNLLIVYLFDFFLTVLFNILNFRNEIFPILNLFRCACEFCCQSYYAPDDDCNNNSSILNGGESNIKLNIEKCSCIKYDSWFGQWNCVPLRITYRPYITFPTLFSFACAENEAYRENEFDVNKKNVVRSKLSISNSNSIRLEMMGNEKRAKAVKFANRY